MSDSLPVLCHCALLLLNIPVLIIGLCLYCTLVKYLDVYNSPQRWLLLSGFIINFVCSVLIILYSNWISSSRVSFHFLFLSSWSFVVRPVFEFYVNNLFFLFLQYFIHAVYGQTSFFLYFYIKWWRQCSFLFRTNMCMNFSGFFFDVLNEKKYVLNCSVERWFCMIDSYSIA
jgi:hypothetical protein